MKDILMDLEKIKEHLRNEKAEDLFESIHKKLELLKTKSGIKKFLDKKKLSKVLEEKRYERELSRLQLEILKLQTWIYENNKRVMVIFEGRDTAGKSSAIKRFIEHLNPRKFRVVALPKPSEVEQGQFFFQRYFAHLPNAGEITFFDRSWYNRAIIEPLLGFCTQDQYERFMKNVSQVENALINDGIILIKFWFDIDRETQLKRFEERMSNPYKFWKLSPIDEQIKGLWDEVTIYKDTMFKTTHSEKSPWVIIDSNDKKKARLEAMKYLLSMMAYTKEDGKEIDLSLDSDIIKLYK
ncbi:MAG: polyphosphate kinase 2 [Campylobacterales bacterium]|nr:polyphosphate kinase 2 [Campylobacterales bacterium]